MNTRPWAIVRACLAIATATLSGAAVAQSDYPNRTIRLIVPASPGGGTDFTARLIAQRLSALLNQSVVVENRAGASGNIGAELVARAAPDGYSLVMPITSFPMNPSLFKKMPFDTERDFAPVVLASVAPLYLVVNPSVPANSVSELIALAKAKPDALNYANSGRGTSAHLAGELFKRMAGIEMTSLPYKGGGPAVIDLIAGQVQVYFSTIPAAIAHVQTGKLRGLAVTSSKRVEQIPNVPTVAESGLPGFEVVGWFGIFAPAGTPAPIIGRLSTEINRILKEPQTRDQFAGHGLVPGGGTPEELGTFLKTELNRWGTLIRSIGINPE
jgi:tripartite-type tricarboxylate transporter receptor subunit TctC